MTLKRSFAIAVAAMALVGSTTPSAFAASGSVTVPLVTLGCERNVDVWWNTEDTPPAGTSGNVSC
jgi:hypothetical protein